MPKRRTEVPKDTDAAVDGPTKKRGQSTKAVVVASLRSDPTITENVLVTNKVIGKPPAQSRQFSPLIEVIEPGELFVFGSNDAGQLALEDPGITKRYPFAVSAEKFGGLLITRIAAGGMHSVAVNSDGRAYSWGCNDEGALGTGKSDNEDDWIPKLIASIPQKIVSVSAGDSHTAFLTEEGQIYMVGTMRDPSGSFGLKQGSSEPTTSPFLLLDSKSRSEGVIKDRAIKISSGHNHFGYLNVHGEVHLLGDISNGQLGPIPTYRADGGRTGKAYFLQRRKVFIKSARHFLSFSDVCCTPYGTFVRDKANDQWWACGNNSKNQLGFPHEPGNEIQSVWREVQGLRNKNIRRIVGTSTYTAALAEDGILYMFGYKEYLGFSADVDNGCTDYPVQHPADLSFADVDCSSNSAIVAVTKAGDVYAWGSPSSSVLGTNPDEDETVPVPLQIKSKNTDSFKMMRVSVGALHALLVGKKRV